MLGILGGTLTFAELFPRITGFYERGSGEGMTIPQAFGRPYAVVVFAVVLMAVGGYYGAEMLEKKFAAPG